MTKSYKLLKDLPGLRAGSTFVEVDTKDMENLKLIYQIDDDGVPRCAYTWIDPEKPNEWFEEIQESTDSIHWKPKIGDEYFYINDTGYVHRYVWSDTRTDNRRLDLGIIYPTEEECAKAKRRKLAKARLQRTSNFKPDFENGNGGWIVYYSYETKSLFTYRTSSNNAGEPVHYRTEEDAEKSIKENREYWLIYFGIDQSDIDKS